MTRGNGDFSIGSNVWPGISKLIEECGEVAQVCGKLMGSSGQVMHWDGSNLKERLEDELGDLFAAIMFVMIHTDVDPQRVTFRQLEKLALFVKWHAQHSNKP